MNDKRFIWNVRPVALLENQVIGENCRFTILTNRLIRMEYSKDNIFEDRASQTVFYRDLEKTQYTINREKGLLIIKTDELIITYKEGFEFSSDTLSIKLINEPASEWKFSEDFEELGGTTKTLDEVDGAIPVGKGVCSRFGFSVLDDSDSMVLCGDGWVDVRHENTLDLYFFGYGYNYLDAVRDFYRITGAPSMLPAYALGNWWSRYYAYTQQEYIDLMEKFRSEDIPFSVAVIDMDWHVVIIPPEYEEEKEEFKDGWTGYTWNKELFPDYKAFLKYLKDNNLHSALNLHPAQGVRKHEEMYEKMAIASGIDPKSGQRIPFDILSPKAMANYFDILHHPYEEDGVDFWWMDWQQGTNYWWMHEPNVDGKLADPREKLDPLWMINHLHILDISRNGKRPMFFSRFSGAGSHRYPVGFSGDTVVSWESLKFQPYFTATASNIGYCWWSHDIGGHMYGYRDDELTVRWIQLGVFSPINRLHSSCGEFQLKEPWYYNMEAGKSISKWLRMRHQLFPYIYTMNYRCHNELLPLVQPMYYSHPKCSSAYEVKNQFWFGSELIIAPITEPNNKKNNLGRVEAWLPKGDWFDFNTGLHYYSKNGRKMELFRDISEYPILAKAGAIVPLCSHYNNDNKIINDENMEINVFPGNSNTFELYEDSGDYYEFENGSFATTLFELEWDDSAVLTINPAKGDLSLIPQKRNWKINLRGFNKNINIEVLIDGKTCQAEKVYVSQNNTLQISVSANVSSEIEICVSGENLIHDNSDAIDRIFNILCKANISNKDKYHYYECIKLKDTTVHTKLLKMGDFSPEDYHTVKAIKELLTLTVEEY